MIVLLLAAVGFAAPDVDGPQAVDVPAPVVAHDHTTFSLLEGESVAQGVDRALASRREIPCDQVLDLGSTADVRTALAAATERELHQMVADLTARLSWAVYISPGQKVRPLSARPHCRPPCRATQQ